MKPSETYFKYFRMFSGFIPLMSISDMDGSASFISVFGTFVSTTTESFDCMLPPSRHATNLPSTIPTIKATTLVTTTTGKIRHQSLVICSLLQISSRELLNPSIVNWILSIFTLSFFWQDFDEKYQN